MPEELVNALAFILVIEGALYALFPESMRKLAQRIERVPSSSLRNSGFLPPLAADRVYDHITVQFPALSDMLGGRRKGLPPKCPPGCFRKKNVPIQPWLTWLSLLALGCS